MDEVYARDIDTEGCENCPLYKRDCVGGMSSTGGEPPCLSWDDDTLVYSGMYDNDYE